MRVYMYNYTIDWSEEDQVYLARVEQFPLLITHGHTAALALEALEDLLLALED